ncbi:hypothetical protein KY284_006235 [Solanum tuberosum]|nr:hypothetical protein KY284_006235 [Solanum tuberosum]
MTIRNQRLSLLKQPISSTLNQHLIDYPTPSNLSYWWGFGSLAGICLVIQIVTGVFLAMHYTPHVDLAFNSVEHIMGDVEGGWLLRYMHANGATFIGYVLPWGQMSFWGATVITSLASAIPVVGDTIVTWLWGGFSVDNDTNGNYMGARKNYNGSKTTPQLKEAYLRPFKSSPLGILFIFNSKQTSKQIKKKGISIQIF